MAKWISVKDELPALNSRTDGYLLSESEEVETYCPKNKDFRESIEYNKLQTFTYRKEPTWSNNWERVTHWRKKIIPLTNIRKKDKLFWGIILN